MKTRLTSLILLPLALATACGDDDTGSGGAGGDDGSTSAETTSATGNGSTTDASSTASGNDGGGGSTGDGGAGGAGGDDGGFGGSQGTGGFDFGDVMDVTPGEWSFVDFPESRCMNDTPTGIGVNPSPTNTTDLVIFLMGGNACFNQASCFVTANKDGYDAEKFANDPAVNADLFAREEANPIGDWSFVYVPYCTGDVHAGDRASIEVGGEERRFRGYVNMHDYLERIVPTFPDVTRVLLTGVSAGGFGAAFNYDQVKRAFGDDVDVILLDDSGPPMAEEFVPECLQAAFRERWGLDNTLPLDCADCFAGETFMEEYMDHVTTTYADQRFGLISSEADETIRSFWGFGNDDCANLDALALPSYPAEQFTDGLVDLRDRVAGENFALFMPPGERHVWVNDAEGLATTVDGSPTLLAWIEQLINDDPEWQSWPNP